MKSLIISVFVIFNTSVQANTVSSVFMPASPLPRQLQIQVLRYLNDHCPAIISTYGLNEISTTVTESDSTSGGTDYNFATLFFSQYFGDGMHPSRMHIRVTSAEKGLGRTHTFSVMTATADIGCN